MGLLDNDSYLTNVSKICQKIKNKGSFRITIKRDRLFEDKPSIKKGFKKEILARRAYELEKDSNLMSKLLFKVKQNDNAFSTKVEETKIISFTSSFLNIFRLNFFKNEVMKVEKKAIAKKGPTPRNEKSKRTLKRKEKNRKNQDRRKKKKILKKKMRKQKQKQNQPKQASPNQMEIEKS